MTLSDELRRAAAFVVLCLAQVLVFNHIRLFNCATALVYVYFVVAFPRSYPYWALLLWSFFLGLFVDLFSNTPGLSAASLTLIAFLQPFVLTLFVPREAPENLRTAVSTMGLSKFFTFAAILVFLYCLVFFTIEAFNFFNWLQWALNILGSTLLTIALLMTLESVRK